MFGGDCCQVMSSAAAGAGGGSAFVSANPEAFFSSSALPPPFSSAMGLPFTFPFHTSAAAISMKEIASGVAKEEEMEGHSGGSGGCHLDALSSYLEEHDDHLHIDLQKSTLPEQSQSTPATAAEKKKKRYHRHTAHQIQEMEALFKECPHPDDKQRLKLSQELGLKPRQVKFWFQNRRTQMKAQQDRADNVVLRAENDTLKNENFRLQAAVRSIVCPSCGTAAVLGEMSADEQHLRIENSRLKDELERLTCMASRFAYRQAGVPSLGGVPPPFLVPPPDLDMSIYSRHFEMDCGDSMIPVQAAPTPAITGCQDPDPLAVGSGGAMAVAPVVMEQERLLLLNLAATAADHLKGLCSAGEPLWLRCGTDSAERLDLDEHARAFHWPIERRPPGGGASAPPRVEATRDSAVIIMNSVTLVDAFLDAGKWKELFGPIVGKATTVQVLSHGSSGGHLGSNGSLLLMQAELQFQSPLVPSRNVVFFRYCARSMEEGTWLVVDFSADGYQAADDTGGGGAVCRRMPSGCIIQDMPNGYSRVTWIEHCEVADEKPLHPVFNHYVVSGSAYGATRWLSTLQRQCERLASLMARNISDLGVIPSLEARKNMMKLSQRMVATFFASISTSAVQSWTALSDCAEDAIRVTTRKNTEPGQPTGVILTAASTKWLPFSHQQVFDLLTDEHRRSQLDIIPSGSSFHEVAHIANGSHPKDCISLLRINVTNNSTQTVELLLQESSFHHAGGSSLVCATVDVDAVQVAMSGDDPSYISLLPMGFIVLPAPAPPAADKPPSAAPGCLLTVGMQVLATAAPSAKLNLSSVTAINNHVNTALNQITAALGPPSSADGSAVLDK